MIGTLTEQVIIEAPAEANDHGDVTTTWSTLATVWASVHPAGSTEAWRQQQVYGELSHVVRMRARTNVSSKHRIKMGTRYLEILGPARQIVVDGTTLVEFACREREV